MDLKNKLKFFVGRTGWLGVLDFIENILQMVVWRSFLLLSIFAARIDGYSACDLGSAAST